MPCCCITYPSQRRCIANGRLQSSYPDDKVSHRLLPPLTQTQRIYIRHTQIRGPFTVTHLQALSISSHLHAGKDPPTEQVDVELVYAIHGSDDPEKALSVGASVVGLSKKVVTHKMRPSSLQVSPAVSSSSRSTRPTGIFASRSRRARPSRLVGSPSVSLSLSMLLHTER